MRIFLSGLLLIFSCQAWAQQELHIVAGDTGFHCRVERGVPAGFMCDLVTELMVRLGYRQKIEMVPHARLKAMMNAPARATLFLSTSRNANNENKFQWVVEALKDEFVLVTSGKSNRDASTIQLGKQLPSVGILRGAESEGAALRLGFTNLQPAASQAASAKKLDLGRIDAWISTWNGARHAAAAAGIDVATLRRGAPVVNADLYVVATLDVGAEEIQRWRLAFDAMKADGTVEKLMKRNDVQLIKQK